MLTLNNLAPNEGARKAKKRVGRGPGSGSGKTAARGHKGARARSGYSASPGFEGGQMPLQRRLPKRGFTPLDRVEFLLVNICQLDVFETGSSIDIASLVSKGLIKSDRFAVKILGNGDITKSLKITANKFSQSAKDKIVAAGGSFEEIA